MTVLHEFLSPLLLNMIRKARVSFVDDVDICVLDGQPAACF